MRRTLTTLRPLRRRDDEGINHGKTDAQVVIGCGSLIQVAAHSRHNMSEDIAAIADLCARSIAVAVASGSAFTHVVADLEIVNHRLAVG